MKEKYGLTTLFILLIMTLITIPSFASDNYHIFPVTRIKETEIIERNLNIPVMIEFENNGTQEKYNDIIRNDIFDFIIEAQKDITAIFGSGVSSWNAELFNAMLSYIGDELVKLSIIALIVGIGYLVWAEFTYISLRKERK